MVNYLTSLAAVCFSRSTLISWVFISQLWLAGFWCLHVWCVWPSWLLPTYITHRNHFWDCGILRVHSVNSSDRIIMKTVVVIGDLQLIVIPRPWSLCRAWYSSCSQSLLFSWSEAEKSAPRSELGNLKLMRVQCCTLQSTRSPCVGMY